MKRIFGFLAGAGLALAQQYNISTVAGGAPPATPAQATSISIGPPQRVMADGANNIYFTSLNCVFKLTPGGTVSLVAGNSRAGFSGDGGPATQAQLNGPSGMAMDAACDLYISDTGNKRVRMVTPDGNITTVAGTGVPDMTGDGDLAIYAQLHAPSGVAVDGSGNLYIADSANQVVRIVTPDGNINLFAGNWLPNYYGDSGSPFSAGLHNPKDVSAEKNGTVLIVDTGNQVVRSVTGGVISTVAGSGAIGFAGDAGPATKSALFAPQAVAVDPSGAYYLADSGNMRIRKVDTSANINTSAGNGSFGFGGDGSSATSGSLGLPTGVALDGQGNIYIADTFNYRIRKVTSSGNISTVAGNGNISNSGDGGPATWAQLNGPAGVAVDKAGNGYISDSRNSVMRIASKSSISSLGGGSLVYPRGSAADGSGNVYVADTLDNRVRRIGADGSVTTFAGSGTAGYGGDGGPAGSAMLTSPSAVAVDPAGNVYIADFGNNRVRKVGADGNIVTIAGSGLQGFAGDGAAATQAGLNGPLGLAADASGVYIADSGNNRIRKVTPDGNINTIAGTGVPTYGGDSGLAINTSIVNPTGLAVDSSGTLYFTDGGAYVFRIDTSGVVTTIAGNGSQGYAGDGGSALQGQLNGPSALAVDASGNLYVADTGNSAIRLLQPASQ